MRQLSKISLRYLSALRLGVAGNGAPINWTKTTSHVVEDLRPDEQMKLDLLSPIQD